MASLVNTMLAPKVSWKVQRGQDVSIRPPWRVPSPGAVAHVQPRVLAKSVLGCELVSLRRYRGGTISWLSALEGLQKPCRLGKGPSHTPGPTDHRAISTPRSTSVHRSTKVSFFTVSSFSFSSRFSSSSSYSFYPPTFLIFFFLPSQDETRGARCSALLLFGVEPPPPPCRSDRLSFLLRSWKKAKQILQEIMIGYNDSLPLTNRFSKTPNTILPIFNTQFPKNFHS